MIFFTFNDQPSGIYKSQVIEVCEVLDELNSSDIMLIAFIPRQKFVVNKRKIREWRSKSVVLPILPGLRFWKFSLWIFFFLNKYYKHEKIVARGPMATYIAIQSKKKGQKVVYDARGLVKAEIEEFHVFQGDLARKVITMERESILHADFRIAVSNALVNYWMKEYGYNSNKHVIIPCWSRTLQGDRIEDSFFDTSSPILVYSGSTSPWQSFPLLIKFITHALEQSDCKILLMCCEDTQIQRIVDAYPGRVMRIFVPENQVYSYLSLCDYGLLIRDVNDTNRVASPVKFSEYLMCGLQVLISPFLGDYSKLVNTNRVGTVVDTVDVVPLLTRLSEEQREKSKEFAYTFLSANALMNDYKEIINF